MTKAVVHSFAGRISPFRKLSRGLVVGAALCACAGLFADTLTWTGNGGDGKWSTPANWTSTGSHAIPQSGDSVYAMSRPNETVNNDIPGLSLAHLELIYGRAGSGTTRLYATFAGEKIALTGGLNALKTVMAEQGGSEKDYEITCKIPFELTGQTDGGTNKFTCACRVAFSGNLTGDGLLWFACDSICSTLKCDNSCAMGTYATGTGICDLNGINSLGDGSTKAVFACHSTGGMRRLYTDLNAWIDVRPPAGRPDSEHTFTTYANRAFNGPITGDRLVLCVESANLSNTLNGDVTIDGPVHAMPKANGFAMIFNGKLTCVDFGRYDTAYAGNNTFNHKDNSIANFYAYTRNSYAGAKNCFGAQAVVRFGRLRDDLSLIDCKGFDQQIDRIEMVEAYKVSASGDYPKEGHVFTSSTGPATLTLAATANCTTDARFSGGLSLVWAPRGDYTFSTYADCGREMPMTGSIRVNDGTFRVNGANSFPNASAVEVADNAAFVWSSSVALGLRGVKSVRLGECAVFTVADGAAFPFIRQDRHANLALDLAATSRLALPADVSLPVASLATNGVALPMNAVYCGDPDATDAIYLPQLAGTAARLRTVPYTPFTPLPLSSKAYVQDGLVCQLDGIDNAGRGVHDPNATVWTDLAGVAGDFAVSAGVGVFTDKALKKSAAGYLGRNETRRNDVKTLEVAVSDIDKTVKNYILAAFLGSNEYILAKDVDGFRYFGFDAKNLGWKTAARPNATSISSIYVTPLSKATAFYVDGTVPEGEPYGEESWSDNDNPKLGMTLGGRSISWAGSDTNPYGYSLNAVRMYSRVLSAEEVARNHGIDAIRFRDTIPEGLADYRRSEAGTVECRCVFETLGGAITVNGEGGSSTAERWAEPGDRLTVTVTPDAAHTFVGWVGDVDAIVEGTSSSPTITVLVDRALSLSVSMRAERLVVSANTLLTEDVFCAGVLFTGGYTLSAVPGVSVTIEPDGQGIEVAEGSAAVTCPVAIGPTRAGGQQTILVPAKASLALRGGFGGNADIKIMGEGKFAVEDGAAYAGDVELTNAVFTVKGEFLNPAAAMTVWDKAQLVLDNATVGGLVTERVAQSACWLVALENTTNRLLNGFVCTGQERQLSLAKGSQTWFERNFSNRAAAYIDPVGAGALHLTNITYASTMAGGYQPKSGAQTHLWQPNALLVGNHISASGAFYSHAANTLGHSPLRLYNDSLWDLGGFDQTIGRFSWMDGYTTCEIRSATPATLRVYQDIQSGSASDRGTVTYRGKLTGFVSLVKTGNETTTETDTTGAKSTSRVAEDLLLGSAIAATGDVSVVWGLLSFTNGTDRVGSWKGCGKATAGRTVDARGDVHHGTLELRHSKVFGKQTDVYVAKGAKVRLVAGVAQRVHDLYFEGDDSEWVKQPTGVWGSSASGASHRSDDFLEGAGVLNVHGDTLPTLIIIK